MNLKLLIPILLLSVSVTAQTSNPSRSMVVTFDDLPYAAVDQNELPRAHRATKEILRVLQKHHVPAVALHTVTHPVAITDGVHLQNRERSVSQDTQL
jgi:peptidoglycan/xylan/chitin deacetylase (PgdA/CDA1 family)